MADFKALEGITEAIEAESRTPSPSHQNLARLVAMALRNLMTPSSPEVQHEETHSAVELDDEPAPNIQTVTLPYKPKKAAKKSK